MGRPFPGMHSFSYHSNSLQFWKCGESLAALDFWSAAIYCRFDIFWIAVRPRAALELRHVSCRFGIAASLSPFCNILECDNSLPLWIRGTSPCRFRIFRPTVIPRLCLSMALSIVHLCLPQYPLLITSHWSHFSFHHF